MGSTCIFSAFLAAVRSIFVGQRTLYREAIRENCESSELSCAKLWYFTLVSTEFIIILCLTSYHASADHLQFQSQEVLPCVYGKKPVKACASARGSWVRRRKSLAAWPPREWVLCTNMCIQMLLGAIRKSEKISHSLVFVWYLASSNQLKSGYVILIIDAIICILVWGFFVWNLLERSIRETPPIRESQETQPTPSDKSGIR